MPSDSRRFCGPDDSEPYQLYLNKNGIKALPPEPFTNKKGERRDGRKANEQRKIYIKTGVVTKVKGSAYLEIGSTKVLVSVYEPREIPRLSEFTANGELYCEFRYAPFCTQTRRSLVMQSDEKDLSLVLKRALEPAVCRAEFPNCQVDIFVLVLDDDGSCLSTAITAAGIALVDAGVPMFDMVGAATMGIQGEDIFLDPTYLEQEYCLTSFPENGHQIGIFMVSYLPSLGQISNTTLFGSVTMEKIIGNLDLLTDSCTNVVELARDVLKKDVLKKSVEEEQSDVIL